MEWFLWMLGVALLGVAAVASSGRLGELPPPVSSTPAPYVPEGDLTGDDLRATQFSVVARGYSMAQVDELLDRVARQLDVSPRRASAEPSDADLASAAQPEGASTAGPGGSVPTPK